MRFNVFDVLAASKVGLRAATRVIENAPDGEWWALTLDETVGLFVMFSTDRSPVPISGRETPRKGVQWTFAFGPDHLRQMCQMQDAAMPVWLALACVLKPKTWYICLLDPGQVGEALDCRSASPQNLFVADWGFPQLRVYNDWDRQHPRRFDGQEIFSIPRNRFKDWLKEIAGG